MTTNLLTESLRETLALFEEGGAPRTTPEVAADLDLGRRSTYERLERLVDHDQLDTKKVGANARVWWQPLDEAVDPSSADTEGEGNGSLGRSDPLDSKRRVADDEGRAQRDLEEIRNRYDALIDYFPNGAVALVDADFDYVAFGGTPEGSWPLEQDDLQGRNVREVLPDELATDVVPAYERALDGHPSRFEATVDGRKYDFTFVPVEDNDGEVVAAMGLSQDITDRKKGERELQQRVRQQRVVTELGQDALELHDLDDLMSHAAELVAETLGTDYCKILDLDDAGEQLLLRQGIGWQDGIVGTATVSATEDNSQAAYTLGVDSPVIVENLSTEARFTGPDLLTDYDVRSGISVIIGPPDDPWGILATHDTDVREYQVHDVNFVQSVATILATAIKRHEYEQRVVRQRDRLGALNSLNEVFHEVTEAVIGQSTREELETAVVESLADADPFSFAWIGEVDSATETVTKRAEAGIDGYLDAGTISVDPHDERSQGPEGQAYLAREVRTTRDAATDGTVEPWRDHVTSQDIRSIAGIPIVFEDRLFGLLGVYAERPAAFEAAEKRVFGQLGEVIGHAIAAIERKRALMSEEVVELEYHVADIFQTLGTDVTVDGRVSLDRAIPNADGEYLVYGTAPAESWQALEALEASLSHWVCLSDLGVWNGRHRFELRLDGSPVLSDVASIGGYVKRAVIEDGDFDLTIHLPPSVNTRSVTATLTNTYATADLVAQRQFSRTEKAANRFERLVHENLTDRQRTAVEAAYISGFFEWPRENNGQDVAESLGVSPPTFHQHLRKAEQTVFETLLSRP